MPFLYSILLKYATEDTNTANKVKMSNSVTPLSNENFEGLTKAKITSTGGVVRCLGDSYYMSADVSQFEPHDVVVLAYNQHVVIHAQKVLDDGSISDTFTHKSLFPEDMDPLSVSGTLNPDGTLVVSVRRKSALTGKEHLVFQTPRNDQVLQELKAQGSPSLSDVW
uniref:SHSP domain-containing protein n=1 Tax=Oreochromis aureus TaxID=47969 RepID=A0A668UJJ4_OREAU